MARVGQMRNRIKRSGSIKRTDRRADAPLGVPPSSASVERWILDLARLLARVAARDATRTAHRTQEEDRAR